MPKNSRPSKGVTAAIHADGAVLFDTAGGCLFSLNRTGASIWRGLEIGHTIETIAGEISRSHGISFIIALEHTQRFIGELAQQALVTPRELS